MDKATEDTRRGTDRSAHLVTTVVICFVLSWVTTSMRAHVRIRMLRATGWDDYMMFFCQAIYTAHLLLQGVDIWYGNGRHAEFLPRYDNEMALKFWFLCGFGYILGTMIVKFSIGLLLLRFVTSAWQTYIVYLTMSLAGVLGTFYFFFYAFTCRPMSFFWNLDPDARGTCFPGHVWIGIAYFEAAMIAVADGIYAVLPALIVYNTTAMESRIKVAVTGLLAFGSLGVLGTIVRVPFLASFKGYKGDFLFDTIPISILSSLELGFAIVTANCATFRPLFQRFGIGVPTRRAPAPPSCVVLGEEDVARRRGKLIAADGFGVATIGSDRRKGGSKGSGSGRSPTGMESLAEMDALELGPVGCDMTVEAKGKKGPRVTVIEARGSRVGDEEMLPPLSYMAAEP